MESSVDETSMSDADEDGHDGSQASLEPVDCILLVGLGFKTIFCRVDHQVEFFMGELQIKFSI